MTFLPLQGGTAPTGRIQPPLSFPGDEWMSQTAVEASKAFSLKSTLLTLTQMSTSRQMIEACGSVLSPRSAVASPRRVPGLHAQCRRRWPRSGKADFTVTAECFTVEYGSPEFNDCP